MAADFVRSRQRRTYWLLRIIRPPNLFQPFFETSPDRYPKIFQFVRDELGDTPSVRLLSFGCSTGEEVFSLRRYFSAAEIRGLDINPVNVAVCMKRWVTSGDRRISFALTGSTKRERTASYDAVFCMAVLRHSDLAHGDAQRCDHLITFDAFERTVTDLARCVRPGGFLVIQHSNFRFSDTDVSSRFQPVLSVPRPDSYPPALVFGRDNRRLAIASYDDVVFRKLV